MLKKLFEKIQAGMDMRDIHAYGGLMMLGFGLHEISPPAAWSVLGLIVFWIGVRR